MPFARLVAPLAAALVSLGCSTTIDLDSSETRRELARTIALRTNFVKLKADTFHVRLWIENLHNGFVQIPWSDMRCEYGGVPGKLEIVSGGTIEDRYGRGLQLAPDEDKGPLMLYCIIEDGAKPKSQDTLVVVNKVYETVTQGPAGATVRAIARDLSWRPRP